MQKYVKVEQGQALTGGLEFFAVKTGAVSLVPTAAEGTAARKEQDRAWAAIVEVISMRAAPVIMSALDADGFTFAVEKVSAVSADEAQAKIRELGEVAFGGSTVDLSGVEVVAVELKLHGA